MLLCHNIVANENEFKSFRDVVEKAGLPFRDLDYQNQILISYFVNGEAVGTGGLEIMNQYGLLRSIAVSNPFRNKEIGKLITHDILDNARNSNLEAVYLLTETAQAYFQKLGFEIIEREMVPAEIKSTTEFAQVCPALATCMVLKLMEK